MRTIKRIQHNVLLWIFCFTYEIILYAVEIFLGFLYHINSIFPALLSHSVYILPCFLPAPVAYVLNPGVIVFILFYLCLLKDRCARFLYACADVTKLLCFLTTEGCTTADSIHRSICHRALLYCADIPDWYYCHAPTSTES